MGKGLGARGEGRGFCKAELGEAEGWGEETVEDVERGVLTFLFLICIFDF